MARSSRVRQGTVGGGRLRAVALVGIDGSGKTTQGHRVADALTAAGVPATYWQNAGGRRWLGRLARRLGRGDAQRLLGRNGMLLAESALRWLAIARTLVRSRLNGRIAVMDRYAVCQYASIRAHGGHRWERLARILYRIFPPPDVTFLLSVEPREAYQRIEARGTDHESIDYLTAADQAYRSLPEFPAFVVVDANGTPDQVTRAIRAHLGEWLPALPVPVDPPAPPPAAPTSAGPSEPPPAPQPGCPPVTEPAGPPVTEPAGPPATEPAGPPATRPARQWWTVVPAPDPSMRGR